MSEAPPIRRTRAGCCATLVLLARRFAIARNGARGRSRELRAGLRTPLGALFERLKTSRDDTGFRRTIPESF